MTLILLSYMVGSCYIEVGSNPSESGVARSPFGARVHFQFPGTPEVSGTSIRLDHPVELLVVSDSGLLVEADGPLVMVRFTSFETAELQDSPGVGTIRGERPDPGTLEEAREYSRYPFGLPDEQRDLLLRQRGQSAVWVK
jgi:hypothetical protein